MRVHNHAAAILVSVDFSDLHVSDCFEVFAMLIFTCAFGDGEEHQHSDENVSFTRVSQECEASV